ncbi:hypothetical protein [Haloarcula rubra]|uniref:hypothetical protein n=1 Tax=Haloarcula rubra TaxID=2487747 RepID=UPI001C73C7A8|nr:hypothetical protein [Halomicroarcula rubra]
MVNDEDMDFQIEGDDINALLLHLIESRLIEEVSPSTTAARDLYNQVNLWGDVTAEEQATRHALAIVSLYQLEATIRAITPESDEADESTESADEE